MEMSGSMTHGQYWHSCSCPVNHGGSEEEPNEYSRLTSKQVDEPAIWSRQNPVMPNYSSIPYFETDEKFPTEKYDDEDIAVSQKFKHIFRSTEKESEQLFAGMALPTDQNYDLDKEPGLLTVDNGATTTLTRSLFNMSDVEPKAIKIHLAGEGMHIKTTHVGRKTYYVRDVTGSIRPVTTKAFYAPELNQNLLSGRSLINARYRVILDLDPKVAGIFPVVNGQIDAATGIPFADFSRTFLY